MTTLENKQTDRLIKYLHVFICIQTDTITGSVNIIMFFDKDWRFLRFERIAKDDRIWTISFSEYRMGQISTIAIFYRKIAINRYILVVNR